ncbi:hypothetical protein GCM10009665_04640 [Kitasatospora nipponensis]|uniref:PH (Pleckstrin Homology) domain-containing protein n=1 Tax=Kitasatospora nipponensis TaxID=258049 RepID=A0ABP4G973_9ACTN
MSQETDDLPWISVKGDTSAARGLLLKASPVILFGMVRIGLLMARGRGSSAGAGPAGLVMAVVAVAVPLVWLAARLGLRAANARIRLDEGLLTVRDSWGRRILSTPVEDITGLHQVRLPVEGENKFRIVLTSRDAKPLMIDARRWQPDTLRQLWPALGVPVRDHGFLTFRELRSRLPGVRVPWHQAHAVLFAVFIVIVTIAYVALIVNLPFLL